jgi:hypothetical protein
LMYMSQAVLRAKPLGYSVQREERRDICVDQGPGWLMPVLSMYKLMA